MTDDRLRPRLAPAERQEPEGHPVIATAICALLLIIGSANSPAHSGPPAGEGLAGLLGYVFGSGVFAAILWAIAQAITIKRASRAWQVGSLIFLVVIGLICGLARLGGIGADRRADARDTTHQLRQILDSGTIPDRIEAGNGPMSRITATLANHVLADQRAFNHDVDASGYAQIVGLVGLTRTSPVLRRCSELGALAARARALSSDSFEAALASARQVGDAAVAAGEMTPADENSYFDGAQDARASFAQQWSLNAEIMDEAEAVCTLLATRPWVASGGRVLFTHQGDAAEVNGHLGRIRAKADEQARLQQAGAARSRTELNRMESLTR
jgi:hypothetical protein